MCTRFSFNASKEKMKRQFNLPIKHELQKSFNIGTGQNAYILTNKSLELQIFRWGLIPHWANGESVGDNLINAAAEGIGTTLSFRLPIRQRRCLVFADSYYIWDGHGQNAQPYRVSLGNGVIMAMAGVWDVWISEDKRVFKTFSIITTKANGDLNKLTSRMPVILADGSKQARWLGEVSLDTTLNLLQPLPLGMLSSYPITKELMSLDNNYPELHNPVELTL
ncbi:MAG: SOS response-associated peptidase [Aureispira sp.]|nr:SOS response-associated peptidase [Aureispira sp.]